MSKATFLLLLHGAITGALAAAVVDIHAFMKFNSFSDVKTYSWSVASFRWLQGAVTGAIAVSGLNIAGL